MDPRRIRLVACGEVLAHPGVIASARDYGRETGRAYDFRPMFAEIRPIAAEAEIAICHLETPLAADGGHITGYPRFNSPRELAAALGDAGFDVCTTASNHALDAGSEGVARTLEVLDAVGLRHAGTARSGDEWLRPTIFEAGGVRVAVLSYTYALNDSPAGPPWLVKLLDSSLVLADAAEARRAGAEFVVAALHWGDEYTSAPTAVQREIAQELLNSPYVDLLLGHHAHVVQPIEKVGSTKWVAFGLGNALSSFPPGWPPEVWDGVIVSVTVEETRNGFRTRDLGYVPIRTDPRTSRIHVLTGNLDSDDDRESHERTRRAVGPLASPAP